MLPPTHKTRFPSFPRVPPMKKNLTQPARKCQDFAPAHRVPRFLWFQRWSRYGSVCLLASPTLQVYPEPEGDRRHREASTSSPRWLPTDLGNDITPGYRYEVEPSKVQPIRHVKIRIPDLRSHQLKSGAATTVCP